MSMDIGMSISFILIILAIGWIYLLLHNTSAALRVAGTVGTVLFRVLQALFKGLGNILLWIIRRIGGRRG
jgi:hypothetical protein